MLHVQFCEDMPGDGHTAEKRSMIKWRWVFTINTQLYLCLPVDYLTNKIFFNLHFLNVRWSSFKKKRTKATDSFIWVCVCVCVCVCVEGGVYLVANIQSLLKG
jgi:hypothetical protein